MNNENNSQWILLFRCERISTEIDLMAMIRIRSETQKTNETCQHFMHTINSIYWTFIEIGAIIIAKNEVIDWKNSYGTRAHKNGRFHFARTCKATAKAKLFKRPHQIFIKRTKIGDLGFQKWSNPKNNNSQNESQ